MQMRHKKGAATKIGITVEEYDERIERGEKWCTGCKAWHSVSEFGKNQSRYDGLNPSCMEYIRKDSASRYRHHPKPLLTEEERVERRKNSMIRSRAKRHAKRFGADAGDMRGRHGNHLKGPASPRWNGGRMRTSHGYVAIKVPEGHHLRQAHGYAYEHDMVAEEMLGRRLLPGEVVHHINGVRDDNRQENLSVEVRSEHAKAHVSAPGARDPKTGRFLPGPVGSRSGSDPSEWSEDLVVREFPTHIRFPEVDS